PGRGGGGDDARRADEERVEARESRRSAVSYPNDPYGQGGQPNWPGPQGPYQQPNPYQPGQYPYDDAPTPPYGMPPLQPDPGYGAVPPQRRRTGMVIGSLVAVIALVAAGIATYVLAFAGSASGAETPRDAAVNLVNALSKNDVIGLLDGLAPAEGRVAKDYLTESLDELKRLEVVKRDAKPEQITGVAFKAEALVFDDAAEEKVNDHLSITKLVDGTITVSSDWSKVPLTERFLQKAFPDGLPSGETKTYDVSDEIAENDGRPVRIATVKVDGEWYPSLFYSIADAILQEEGEQWPAQPIGASGAESPEAAVRQLLEAALRGDAQRAIELTPPDEMAALHDAGQLIVDAAKEDGPLEEPLDAKLTELRTRVDDVAGGKRVSLVKLATESGDGERFSIEVNGDCATVEEDGEGEELCGRD
ncbi:MAG: flagellar basal body protein FliL, partial [Pseudonocardiaceae bacterium]